jgi:hypothetical protein
LKCLDGCLDEHHASARKGTVLALGCWSDSLMLVLLASGQASANQCGSVAKLKRVV